MSVRPGGVSPQIGVEGPAVFPLCAEPLQESGVAEATGAVCSAFPFHPYEK